MPRPCQRRSRRHRSLLIGLALLSPVHAADYLAGLPPPQPAPSGGGNVLYYLELVINGRDSGQVVPVNAADGHYLLDAAALREAGVRLPGNPAGQVAVDALPEVRADYDSASQQLHLQVPPDWLPEQRQGEPVGPEQALEAGDQWRRVEAALRGLPERTRRIFLLNRIHGRTYAEIAQAMQLSQSAVEKHMMRALDACKASLAGPAGEQARSAQP